ncbi:MAG: mechanosensitive ion channel family protein [Bacteroides sp.]|jgi:MscS family membrane protein|nr:mechanosensitive ion channel family protein [Bacteroides sp.]
MRFKNSFPAFGLILFFLGLIFFPFLDGFGQEPSLPEANQEASVNLSSPYHSIRTHLDFLEAENYYPDSAARAFMYPGVKPEQAREAAIKLKQILDGRGYLIDPEQIPQNTHYTDTVTGNMVFAPLTQFPDIYLIKREGKWTYSLHSIKEIEKLHNEVFPFGIDRFLEVLPHSGTRQFIGLYFWQYLGILIIILLSFLLHKLLTWVFSRLLYRGASQLGYDRLVRPYLLPVAKPLSLFMVFVFIGIVFPVLQLPVEVSKYFIFAFKAILPFFATFVVYRLVDVFSLYLERLSGKSDSNLENHVVPLIRKVLRVFVIIIGGLVILQSIGVNITALLAGISIGGLALALAAQDTLKNLFGSFMIFLDKPFSVGHWITSGDIDGTVEEVGFRSTRVRTFRNSLTYVPNGKLADATIDNHGLRQYRRFYMHIAITYDTPPDLIEVFVEGLRKIVDRSPKTRKDFYIIEFNEMGDFALKIMFYIFFTVPTWPEELKARHEILIEIVRLAEKLGIRFAFPTQTLHMENFPEKRSQTPQYDMDMNEFRKVMEDYFKESQP